MSSTDCETETIMCPICMDDLISKNNLTTTECGHCFHTSCLMQNVMHNGFGCPYCREHMVEEDPNHQNQDEEENSTIQSYLIDENNAVIDNYALTSMRLMFRRVEDPAQEREDQDQDQDQDQEQEQEEEDTEEDEDEDEEDEDEEPVPPINMIIRKLLGQGVTYKDLVKLALLEHDEYSFNEEYEEPADKIFGIIRITTSNYNQTNQIEPEPRFRNIFTTSPMPDFESFTPSALKIICRDYGLRYRNATNARTILVDTWQRHHETD